MSEPSNDLPVIFDAATAVTMPDLHKELWGAVQATGKIAIATNIPHTREGLQLIARCDQPGAEKLLLHVGKELSIVAWRCKPVEKIDDNGEVLQLVHTVLVDANGILYESVGRGIVQCLMYLSIVHGMTMWQSPPVKVRVIAKQTGKGNPFLQLAEVQ